MKHPPRPAAGERKPGASESPSRLPFTEAGLSPALLEAVSRAGYTEMSPIQAAAIPLILAGHDVVGQSGTGTGKTAAFCIPAIERLDPRDRRPQVLVLAPTRELAMQIAEEFRRLAASSGGVRVAVILGGAEYGRQFDELGRGVAIVVGTPGRLADHVARGTLDLSGIRLLVLDEADRMLDMGFREDVEKFLAATPAERQTVFFSATISPDVATLVRSHAREPRTVTIDGGTISGEPLVEQIAIEVPHHAKLAALSRVIEFEDAPSGLVFCNTQHMAEELAAALSSRGCPAECLHGGMAQAQRTRVMNGFKNRSFRILVATDVAARGIDVADLPLVINYDLPRDPEDYVHRIGRTGRAGRQGRAVSLVSGAAVHRLRAFERATSAPILRQRAPTPEEVAARRVEMLVDRLRTTLAGGTYPEETRLVEGLLAEGRSPVEVAAAILRCFAPLPAAANAPEARPERTRSEPPRQSAPPRHGKPAPPRTAGSKRPGPTPKKPGKPFKPFKKRRPPSSGR